MLSLILDSGAFSAWTRKAEIELGAYVDFIRDLYNAEVYVNLDVIPGSFGVPHTAEEVEYSASRGWENLQLLEERGLRAMPVFHQGERFEWLFKMIQAGYDYIGISTDNGTPVRERVSFLDQVFTLITDKDGWPIIKTHGFGVGSFTLMSAYPWYSCDSSNWLYNTSHGVLLIPHFIDGKIDWTRQPTKLVISSSNARAIGKGDHFYNLSSYEKENIDKYCRSHGVPLCRVHDSLYARQALTLITYDSFQKYRQSQPFRRRLTTFFSEGTRYTSGMKIDRIRIYFVEGKMVRSHSTLLRRYKIQNRLLSFWYIKDMNVGDLNDYIATDGRYYNGRDYDDDIEQYFGKTGFLEGGRDAKIRA